jgi:hypothetical protein
LFFLPFLDEHLKYVFLIISDEEEAMIQDIPRFRDDSLVFESDEEDEVLFDDSFNSSISSESWPLWSNMDDEDMKEENEDDSQVYSEVHSGHDFMLVPLEFFRLCHFMFSFYDVFKVSIFLNDMVLFLNLL